MKICLVSSRSTLEENVYSHIYTHLQLIKNKKSKNKMVLLKVQEKSALAESSQGRVAEFQVFRQELREQVLHFVNSFQQQQGGA